MLCASSCATNRQCIQYGELLDSYTCYNGTIGLLLFIQTVFPSRCWCLEQDGIEYPSFEWRSRTQNQVNLWAIALYSKAIVVFLYCQWLTHSLIAQANFKSKPVLASVKWARYKIFHRYHGACWFFQCCSSPIVINSTSVAGFIVSPEISFPLPPNAGGVVIISVGGAILLIGIVGIIAVLVFVLKKSRRDYYSLWTHYSECIA